MKPTLLLLLLVISATTSFAGEQLLNLPAPPKGGRFKTPTELVWPQEPGSADICLWKDDKIAAASITIDDNCAPDHKWWLSVAKEFNLKLTWFIITDRVDGRNKGFDGTWTGWQELVNAGHSVQSHTTNHKSNPKNPAEGDPLLTEEDYNAMYADSLKALNAHLENNFACCIAYPRGEAKEEIASRYAIAGRGTSGVPSPANAIDYMNVAIGSISQGYIEMLLDGHTELGPKWLGGKTHLKRGWATGLYHLVHHGKTPEEQKEGEEKTYEQLKYLASQSDRLWIDTFDMVARYGQERDSATLSSELKDGKIVITLSDCMNDDIFNCPLTVKVRLPADWKSVSKGKLVMHDGAPYALVDIVPDRGETVLTK